MKVEQSNNISNYKAPPAPVILSSTVGTVLTTGAYIYSLAKHKNGKNIFHKVSNIELGISEGIKLCGASTAGGLCGGLISDKPENRKPKLKEAVHQFIGNGVIPFSCLAGVNFLSKGLKSSVRTVLAISTLIASTFLGHSTVDKALGVKEKQKYHVGIIDFAPDADDWVLAASTVIKNKTLFKITSMACPFTYTVLGIKTGLKQKNTPTKYENTPTKDKIILDTLA